MNSTETETVYPDCYLHVRDEHSGQEWIVPIHGNAKLDLARLVDRWVKREFAGELKRDGGLTPRLSGDYYAQIKTDGRPPDSVVCWTSGGFYLKSTY